MEKLYYTNEDYQIDTNVFKDIIKNIENPHLVSLYRGSLPLGVKLSNALDLPLSIVDFQTRDGDTNKPKEPKLIKNASIQVNQTLVVLDDILDLGVTMRQARKMLEDDFPYNKIEGLTLFVNDFNQHLHQDLKWVKSLNESKGRWVVFEDWES